MQKTFADVENAIVNIKDAMQRTEDYIQNKQAES